MIDLTERRQFTRRIDLSLSNRPGRATLHPDTIVEVVGYTNERDTRRYSLKLPDGGLVAMWQADLNKYTRKVEEAILPPVVHVGEVVARTARSLGDALHPGDWVYFRLGYGGVPQGSYGKITRHRNHTFEVETLGTHATILILENMVRGGNSPIILHAKRDKTNPVAAGDFVRTPDDRTGIVQAVNGGEVLVQFEGALKPSPYNVNEVRVEVPGLVEVVTSSPSEEVRALGQEYRVTGDCTAPEWAAEDSTFIDMVEGDAITVLNEAPDGTLEAEVMTADGQQYSIEVNQGWLADNTQPVVRSRQVRYVSPAAQDILDRIASNHLNKNIQQPIDTERLPYSFDKVRDELIEAGYITEDNRVTEMGVAAAGYTVDPSGVITNLGYSEDSAYAYSMPRSLPWDIGVGDLIKSPQGEIFEILTVNADGSFDVRNTDNGSEWTFEQADLGDYTPTDMTWDEASRRRPRSPKRRQPVRTANCGCSSQPRAKVTKLPSALRGGSRQYMNLKVRSQPKQWIAKRDLQMVNYLTGKPQVVRKGTALLQWETFRAWCGREGVVLGTPQTDYHYQPFLDDLKRHFIAPTPPKPRHKRASSPAMDLLAQLQTDYGADIIPGDSLSEANYELIQELVDEGLVNEVSPGQFLIASEVSTRANAGETYTVNRPCAAPLLFEDVGEFAELAAGDVVTIFQDMGDGTIEATFDKPDGTGDAILINQEWLDRWATASSDQTRASGQALDLLNEIATEAYNNNFTVGEFAINAQDYGEQWTVEDFDELVTEGLLEEAPGQAGTYALTEQGLAQTDFTLEDDAVAVRDIGIDNMGYDEPPDDPTYASIYDWQQGTGINVDEGDVISLDTIEDIPAIATWFADTYPEGDAPPEAYDCTVQTIDYQEGDIDLLHNASNIAFTLFETDLKQSMTRAMLPALNEDVTFKLNYQTAQQGDTGYVVDYAADYIIVQLDNGGEVLVNNADIDSVLLWASKIPGVTGEALDPWAGLEEGLRTVQLETRQFAWESQGAVPIGSQVQVTDPTSPFYNMTGTVTGASDNYVTVEFEAGLYNQQLVQRAAQVRYATGDRFQVVVDQLYDPNGDSFVALQAGDLLEVTKTEPYPALNPANSPLEAIKFRGIINGVAGYERIVERDVFDQWVLNGEIVPVDTTMSQRAGYHDFQVGDQVAFTDFFSSIGDVGAQGTVSKVDDTGTVYLDMANGETTALSASEALHYLTSSVADATMSQAPLRDFSVITPGMVLWAETDWTFTHPETGETFSVFEGYSYKVTQVEGDVAWLQCEQVPEEIGAVQLADMAQVFTTSAGVNPITGQPIGERFDYQKQAIARQDTAIGASLSQQLKDEQVPFINLEYDAELDEVRINTDDPDAVMEWLTRQGYTDLTPEADGVVVANVTKRSV